MNALQHTGNSVQTAWVTRRIVVNVGAKALTRKEKRLEQKIRYV